MNQYLTIRQTAKRGPVSEHHLRLMHAQGRLPGIQTGNRWLVNVDLLDKQLEAESLRAACGGEQQVKGVNDGRKKVLASL